MIRCLAALLLCLGLIVPAVGQERVVMVSLEWPPYAGEALPGQGIFIDLARRAFERVGLILEVRFLPWERVVETAAEDPSVDGYLPEYYADELALRFLLSDPIGSGTLGFVERADNPIRWDSLDDLRTYAIGTVSGYLNGEAFDDYVRRGLLRVEPVSGDVINLRKVAAGRIPLAVVDEKVLEYYLATDAFLSDYQGILRFNERPLAELFLYLCFRPDDRGRTLTSAFNAGLAALAIESRKKAEP